MSVDDERASGTAAGLIIGEDVSALSVDELTERIAALRAEIARLESIQALKADHLQAAAQVFGLR